MKYHCDSHRPIPADGMNQAAEIFAARKARAEYGERGRVGACTVTRHSQDGRIVEVSAFIGYPAPEGRRATVGNTVHFTMYLR